MRTASEIVNELKKLDTSTGVTVCSIRRLIKEGRIKSLKVGNRNLINLDFLISYLDDPFLDVIVEDVILGKTITMGVDRMDAFKQNIGLNKKGENNNI
jgi:hypothetical protein